MDLNQKYLYPRRSEEHDSAVRYRRIAEKWVLMPKELSTLSEAIYNRDPEKSLDLVNSDEFNSMITVEGKKNNDILFDQMKEVLLQLYDDRENFIRIENLGNRGRTILNPEWDKFIVAYKKKIDSVNHYRYDNEIQF